MTSVRFQEADAMLVHEGQELALCPFWLGVFLLP